MAACPRARLRLSNSSGEWRHFGRTRNDNIPPTRDAQGGVLLVEPLSLSDPSWTSPLRKRTAVDGGSEPANVVVKLVGPHPGTCREFRQSDSPSLIEHTRCSVGPFFAQHRLTSVRLVAASDPVSTQVPRCCHLKKKKKKEEADPSALKGDVRMRKFAVAAGRWQRETAGSTKPPVMRN